MTTASFQQIAHTIPVQPGIYKYYNEAHELLYVGKAKNLKKRVSSYFNKGFTNYKTHELIQRVHSIEFTIVNSEQDAFLLENSLIKQFRPKYNIQLKDDKSFPFIVIKNEHFPRVFLTRRKINDGSEYLGPYTSVGKVRELLDFIRQNIPLRNCKLNLTPQNIQKKKFKVCLEYHLGNCKGPCEGLQTEEDYKEGLVQIKNLLKGNLAPVIHQFREEMKKHAEHMEFEKAEVLRKKIEHLHQYQSKSTIVNNKLGNVDVFSILEEGDIAYVNYLMVENGTIVQTKTITLEKKLDETATAILEFAIAQLRDTFNSNAPEIIIPFPIHYPQQGVTITVPRGGDRKKLLDLSQKNVNYFQEELKKRKMLHLEGKTDEQRKETLLQLQKDLLLPAFPAHIECFDNSNFQGSFPVSAMVCFKMGIPSKKDYRHFNVKTVKGINDFATMKEAVHRRYKRLTDEQQPLPQLVIIDGGKGQLSAALEAIHELGLSGQMTVIGLAKNEEEVFFSGDRQSLKLDWGSDSLKLLRQIRDEVHRFGITFHRQKRSRGTFKNELELIPGIGKATANMLLKTFRSVKNIKQTPAEKLAPLIGSAKAQLIEEHFKRQEKDK
ncbi:excinuclease ABC subunit UvrC [Agriterribacter sp.]|uniref:excinuclease ABC subunit UvrC n=1 Tax=Agriterribacter sp. TaxID=2821509 RepID=UPI002B683828|nr:excinuclease ABC subunit UvrC [Agriterribacter sp.]HRP55301.1 excinuclease ABC subunit UvrC [Agriterribacter sp.]